MSRALKSIFSSVVIMTFAAAALAYITPSTDYVNKLEEMKPLVRSDYYKSEAAAQATASSSSSATGKSSK